MPGVQKPHWAPSFFVEAALNRRQAASPRQRFDGLDRGALHRGGEGQAGVARPAVDQHGAGAAFAAIAADLGAGQADGLAQIVDQQQIVGDDIVALAAR